jgi:PGAP1-like protein
VIKISVRGGSNGIEAHSDDLTALARLFGAAGRYTAEHSMVLHGYLADPDVLSAAVLDPIGAARFSAALIDALDGPGGFSWVSAQCGENDVKLRAAATAYLAVDRIRAQVEPVLDGIYRFGPILNSAFDGGPRHGRSADGLLASDPQLIDVGMALPWMVPGLTQVVAVCPDGRPDVTARGVDISAVASTPPRNLTDLLAELSHRTEAERDNDVDIRFVYTTSPDGHSVRRVIVDIPGVDAGHGFDPRNIHDPTTISAQARAISGNSTTYDRGVIEAMRQAGVTRSDQVMLVGHSLGGMVAADIARSGIGGFHITHVITAGAPIARIPVPRSVQVLAVENDGDIVPHLDAADNPDQANETTVTLHDNHDDIVKNHDLDTGYLPGVTAIDASANPSVRSYYASMAGFLSGSSIRTEVYQVKRNY